MSWDDFTDKFSVFGDKVGKSLKRLFGSENERITVLDPATGAPITDVAAGTPGDASRAVDVAAAAQPSWAATAGMASIANIRPASSFFMTFSIQ